VSTDRRGFVYGVWAYLLWGLFPLYWPHLKPAGAAEVLAHRIIWSSIFAVLLVGFGTRRGGAALAGVRGLRADPRRLRLLGLASVLIGGNWLIYIWAVNHDHVVETSLGYYINPLVTIGVAVAVLGERLRRPQWTAIAIAAGGVVVLTVGYGRPPWIALFLAVSFAAYSLIKKTVGVGALEGLTVETAFLVLPALAFMALLTARGSADFGHHGLGHSLLLTTSGVATLVPLLLFAGAASRVSLTTLGLLQYLAPTIQFVIGVSVRHEPLPPERLAGFALVWVALVVLTVDGLRRRSMRLVVDAVV
jgi:chloramphenicol-sensitive protein RarD